MSKIKARIITIIGLLMIILGIAVIFSFFSYIVLFMGVYNFLPVFGLVLIFFGFAIYELGDNCLYANSESKKKNKHE